MTHRCSHGFLISANLCPKACTTPAPQEWPMRPIQRVEAAAPVPAEETPAAEAELPSRVVPRQPKQRAPYVPGQSARRVLDAVAGHMHTTPAAILGRDRHKTVSLARQIVAFVLREHQHPQPSLPEIGRELQRDHTTIIAAIKSITRKAVVDEHIRDAIEVGRIAIQSLDMSREIRRLSLRAERDRLVRKASELNEELARMRLDEPIDESSRLSAALGERVQAAE